MAKDKVNSAVFALIVSGALAGCGLYTPDKDPFTSDALIDAPGPEHGRTKQGEYESSLVDHVTCEITQALVQADQVVKLPWLEKDWGTAVSLTLTVEDQTGLSPGITTMTPLPNRVFPFPTGGNVTSPQSFSLSVGGTASANALRTETIQYTIPNSVMLSHPICNPHHHGVLIDGDLKIREFIYDKVQVLALGNGLWPPDKPPYNTWTEEITFVSSYGATVTPTWKLARISANTSSNLVVGQRTNTNDLIITLGPLDPCQKNPPHGAVALHHVPRRALDIQPAPTEPPPDVFEPNPAAPPPPAAQPPRAEPRHRAVPRHHAEPPPKTGCPFGV